MHLQDAEDTSNGNYSVMDDLLNNFSEVCCLKVRKSFRPCAGCWVHFATNVLRVT